ncbi:MAG: M28 family peptidase [Chitinophagaceae bacterium]|nr:M28 family peptidase [Chitinophagaceae bacterium]
MKKLLLVSAIAVSYCASSFAQTNIISTNTTALQVMKGNYDPAIYKATTVISKPADIINGIKAEVSPDTLQSLLEEMQQFENRNTISDTTSPTKGIGAARRWVYGKFQQYSSRNDNRLIPSYLQFDDVVTRCNNLNAQMRNIFCVLPGTDTSEKDVVFVEGHIDSRCEDVCSDSCLAQGMEDNASGTALVIELARVMSKYSYKRTIVFVITIGEEQGLLGARAFAKYCIQEGIKVRGVLKYDVVGGIICGESASQPGCMGAGTIDSLNLRLFSDNGFNSAHKQLARFTKLEYKENLLPSTGIPMNINIMTPIDRTGRGGDHQPFSDNGFTAIRFCAANEHGNADVTNPNYKDRQHTSGDILGVDTDTDMQIDSFFVNFNYLSRLAVINGNALAAMAVGPRTPDFDAVTIDGQDGMNVYMTTEKQYQHYRVAIRKFDNDWDSVYTITNNDHGYIHLPKSTTYFISVASVDNENIESVFSNEKTVRTGIKDQTKLSQKVELLQNHPNPFDGETYISMLANEDMVGKQAIVVITDISGKVLEKLNVTLKQGMNEVLYKHGYNVVGTYTYTLMVDGQPTQSKRMVFAN